MPIEEGWQRSPIPISGDSLGDMFDTIFEASQWSPNTMQCSSIVLILDPTDTFTV